MSEDKIVPCSTGDIDKGREENKKMQKEPGQPVAEKNKEPVFFKWGP